MADSRRELILKAVKRALERASVAVDGVLHEAPAGLYVHRQRRRPLEEDRLPATVIYLLSEDVELDTHDPDGLVGRSVLVRLEHRAIGTPEDEILDPLVSWATKTLLADPSLDGLVFSVAERRLEWAGEELDQDYAACAQDFEIEYDTPEINPEG